MFFKIHIVLSVLAFLSGYPQQSLDRHSDSILHKSYKELFHRIKSEKNKDLKAIYLRTYLNKAKKEDDSERIVSGYKNYLHHSERTLGFIYSDSMLFVARSSGDPALIGAAYLTRGIVYYGAKQLEKALDNYIIAYNYIKNTEDSYQQHKVKYMIGLVKYYLGYYDEAVSLFKQCLSYFKTAHTRAYLNTLHSLGLCYNGMGNYGLCSMTNSLGLAEAERLDNHTMDIYFKHSEGINHYHRENYDLSIQILNGVLPSIIDKNDFANIATGHFYIGRSYWAMHQQKKALPYFKEVDRIFSETEYLRPDLIENYELLIDYYENEQNAKAELYYIKQLIKADRLFNSTYKYLSGKIHKEYNTLELKQQKARIEKLLAQGKRKDVVLALTAIILFFAFLYVVHRHYRNKNKFAKLLLEIRSDRAVPKKESAVPAPDKLNISPKVAHRLLRKLEKFENANEYLQRGLSLFKLATHMGSNNKYVSIIIKYYRKKGFVTYINDLRIDYMLRLLKNEKMYRNYTYKALAEEVGFNSTPQFVSAFKQRTGVSPSIFIKEISKIKDALHKE